MDKVINITLLILFITINLFTNIPGKIVLSVGIVSYMLYNIAKEVYKNNNLKEIEKECILSLGVAIAIFLLLLVSFKVNIISLLILAIIIAVYAVVIYKKVIYNYK